MGKPLGSTQQTPKVRVKSKASYSSTLQRRPNLLKAQLLEKKQKLDKRGEQKRKEKKRTAGGEG